MAAKALSGSGELLVRSSHRGVSPRPCRADEAGRLAEIINAAAQAYRGVIPADCWHDPYMPKPALLADMASGVVFWGTEKDAQLTAVMGIRLVADVALIRHAYVMPGCQQQGAGSVLLSKLRQQTRRRMLVGTWAAAAWAISFYRRNGFTLVEAGQTPALLRRYWAVSQRQIESSVVLAGQGGAQRVGSP